MTAFKLCLPAIGLDLCMYGYLKDIIRESEHLPGTVLYEYVLLELPHFHELSIGCNCC